MVQSINWSNYSPTQIVELKKSGVTVPDDIYDKAQKEVTATSDDSKTVQYEIVNLSSEKNEAEEFTNTLAESGMKKKDILEELIKKCSTDRKEIEEITKEIKGEVSYVRAVGQNAETIQKDIETLSAEIEDKTEEATTEIEAKQAEIQTIQNQETITEADQAKVETLNGEIQTISGSFQSMVDSNTAELEGKTSQVKSISKETLAKMNQIGEAITKAGDGVETGNETIARGHDVKTMNTKERKQAGFKRSGIFGFAGFGDAAKLSNNAIKEGALMNNSAKTLQGEAEKVAKQNEFTIVKAETAEAAAKDVTNKKRQTMHEAKLSALKLNSYTARNGLSSEVSYRMSELKNQ